MAIFYKFIYRQQQKFGVLFVSCMILATILGGKQICLGAEENLNMYSGSYALTDGDTNRILRGKNEEEPMANASTTKILTCIVALELGSLEDNVEISMNASSQPKVKLGVKAGETYKLEELLYGLMLESYNDCAVAIAEHIAGSTEEFARLLNEKSKEIGCTDTYFITPNGLDASDEYSFHHTTASDLCKMMAYCTWNSPKSKEFLKITQTRNYGTFTNRNTFLNQMEGVLSGKTGFTNKAGYCYVAAMEVNGERYCISLLACGWPNNKNYKWIDARKLFEYGMENYQEKTIRIDALEREIRLEGYVGKAEMNELGKENNLIIKSKAWEKIILMSERDKVHTEIVLYTDKRSPIKEGETMGKCNVYLNETYIDSIPLIASESVNIWWWSTIFHTIFYQFLTFSL